MCEMYSIVYAIVNKEHTYILYNISGTVLLSCRSKVDLHL